MDARIKLEHDGGVPVVRLVGEVDMQTVVARARDLYSHTCDGDVTVDLAEVDVLDGPGLTVLLMTLRAADSVRIVNIPPVVRSLLDISSTAEVLEVGAA